MKNRMICLLLAMVLFSAFDFPVSAEKSIVKIYVSQAGSDNGDGTIGAPFQTVERAIDSVSFIKDKKYYSDADIEIVFMGGSYELKDKISIDSALDGVKFTSFNNEKVIWRGNILLDDYECEPDDEILSRIPLTARNKIKCIDISEFITSDEIQPYFYSGNGMLYSDFLLFSDNTLMERAKWPNEEYETINTVYDCGANIEGGDKEERPFVIGYNYDNISNWTGDNIWAEGYGLYLWAYDKIKIAEIDTQNRKITSVPFKSFTGIHDGAKLVFLNIIEELDCPGEWYIDSNNNSKILYYYPVDNSYPELTTRTEELLEINNASDITFENISFKGTRGNGVVVNNSRGIVFDKCSISQIGKVGLTFSNTYNCGIMNSTVHDCGAGGVILGGGVKESLEDGNNFVENCIICRFSEVVPVYTPGIEIGGVGNYAKNNTIFDSWHTAVVISGNNNKLIRNEIFNVVNGSSDAAAVYAYCDSSSRGVEIKENYIHHLGIGNEAPSRMGVAAIYLDGWTSSRTIEKNVLYDCGVCVNLNGGSDNTVNNNLFIDTPISVYAQRVTENAMVYWSHLKNKYYDWDIWHKAYPEIVDYDYDNTGVDVMKNVVISNNLRYNSTHNDDNIQSIPQDIISVSGDTEILKSDFVDYDDLNFSLTDEFYSANPEIERIEFEKIGANVTINDNDSFALLSSAPVVQYSMNEIIESGRDKYVQDDTGNNNLIVGKSEPAILKTNNNGKNYIYSNYALYEPENQQEIKSIDGKITYEAWLCRNSAGGCDTIFNIGDKNTYGKLYIGFESNTSGYVFLLGRGFTEDQNYWVANKTCNYGEWVHLMVSYDDSSDRNVPTFYIDGEKVEIIQSLHGTGEKIDYDEDDVVSIASKGEWKEMTDSCYGKIAIYDNALTYIDALRIYEAEKKFYETEPDSRIVEYSMNNISEGYILNNLDGTTYPLSVGTLYPGELVAKNGRVAFDGNRCLYSSNGYYSVSNTDLPEKLNGDITINMWIKPNVAQNNAILNVGEANKFGCLSVIQEKAGDKVKFIFQRGFSDSWGYWATIPNYEIGKWYNVTIRYSDNSSVNDPEVYINGSKVSIGEVITPSGVAIEITNDLVFSLDGLSAYSTLGSCFGEVVIYDKILSENRIKEYYAKTTPTYNYTLDAVLIDNTNCYITDYSAVNPEGLTIDVIGTNSINIFSIADDEDVSFVTEETSNGVVLKNINLGYGKTYILYDGDRYIKFTTVKEDYTVDYKLNVDNSVSVFLTNNTEIDANIELYATVYEQRKLVSVNRIYKGNLSALTEKKCDDLEILGVNENTNISFIMVDGINTLKPLIRKINVR